MTYTWDTAAIGDAAPPTSAEITDQQIADYCRAVRYENLVYTNQPAAREMGLPGIVAPPAMFLAFAQPRLSGVAASRGCVLPPGLLLNPAGITIRFQGALVTHGDTINCPHVVDRERGKGEWPLPGLHRNGPQPGRGVSRGVRRGVFVGGDLESAAHWSYPTLFVVHVSVGCP